MVHTRSAQHYAYLVLLPGDAAPVWGPGLDGERAQQFARATGCTLIRWRVEKWSPIQGGGKRDYFWATSE